MHNSMEMLKDALCDELEKFAKKGEVSASSLDVVHKLTDTIKNIDKIEALEGDGEYSGAYRYGDMYRGGMSGARYQRRDAMGRYSRDGGSYRRGGYSRAEAKESIMAQIEDLMTDATADEKAILHRAMKSLENA